VKYRVAYKEKEVVRNNWYDCKRGWVVQRTNLFWCIFGIWFDCHREPFERQEDAWIELGKFKGVSYAA